MKKLFLLCAMCLMTLTMPAQSLKKSMAKSLLKSFETFFYTDLGLPSGTKMGKCE